MQPLDALTAPTVRRVSSWEWQGVLQAQSLVHDPYKCSQLLEAVGDGVRYVRDRYAQHLREFPLPPIAVPIRPLTDTMGPYEGHCVFSPVNGVVFATRRWLDTLSGLPVDRVVDITGATGEVSFRGYLLQGCFLVGVEEGDHAIYRFEHGASDPPAAAGATLAQYDATNVEWRALLRKLEVVDDPVLQFPPVTRHVLQSRIEAARILRQSQRVRLPGGEE